MANYHPNNNMMHDNHQQNRYGIDKLIDQSSPSCFNHQGLCSVTHVDAQSKVHFVSKTNRRKQRPPPPVSNNLALVNSPTPGKRGSLSSGPDEDDFQIVTRQKKKKQIDLHDHQQRQLQQNSPVNINNSPSSILRPVTSRTITNSNNNQHGSPPHQNVTTAATRYATSRFPFSPYITRFKSDNVTINQFKEEIVNYFKNNHQIDIEILNCRSTKVKCIDNELDILLYVKDSVSFAALYDQSKWPSKIAGEEYTFPSRPSIPPQLSIIIKNVNVRIDFEEFSNEVKSLVPEVTNVIRMKNKFGNFIHMVKLELSSATVRQDLLYAKKLLINYISYEITEFLAPAYVLICSKCSGIGHFRKQCTEQNETCKTCAQVFPDLKAHQCSSDPKCKHCNGDHLSNSLKCPVIKLFRADLTKKLLSTNTSLTSSTTNKINNYHFDPLNFPPLLPAQTNLNNPMMSKLDDLINKINDVKAHLTNLTAKHEKYEKFMVEKVNHDIHVNRQIDILSNNDQNLKKDLLNHHMLLELHEDMFNKLLFPIFEDLFTLIASQNQDKKGNTLDADLKCRLERYLIQMKKSREGKQRVI